MEEPIVEYVHYVRIVEFQAWNNVRGETQRPFLIAYSPEYDASDEMNVKSKFHEKCMYAAISSCDMHTVKALDEQGNVWRGCEAVFVHGQAEGVSE